MEGFTSSIRRLRHLSTTIMFREIIATLAGQAAKILEGIPVTTDEGAKLSMKSEIDIGPCQTHSPLINRSFTGDAHPLPITTITLDSDLLPLPESAELNKWLGTL